MTDELVSTFEQVPSGAILWSVKLGIMTHECGIETNLRKAKKAAAHALRMHPKGCWCSRKDN